MVGTGLAIAGLASGLLGSKMQSDATKKAANTAADAAKFRPYNLQTPGGSVGFSGQNATGTLDPTSQLLYGLLGNQAFQGLSGQSPYSGFLNFSQGLGNNEIPGLYGAAGAAADQLPTGAYNSFQQNILGLTNQLQGLIGQNSAVPYSQLGLGSLNQAMTGLPSGLDFSQANSFLGQAAQRANATPADVSGLINDRLGLLRQQAAPFEQRAFSNLQDTLFSQGRMGSTGGSLDVEAFARGLGQADLARQVEAQNLGLSAQQQMANINAQSAGLLSNLGNQSAGIAQAGGAFGLDRSGLLGNLGLGTLGQGLTNSSQIANLLGLSGQFNQAGLAGATDFSNLINARAQQRLSNAQSLFGFGNDLSTNVFNQGLSALQGQQSIDQNLRNLIALGGNLGSGAANAGANQAQAILTTGQSPIGGLLSGLGYGILQGGMNSGGGTKSTGLIIGPNGLPTGI